MAVSNLAGVQDFPDRIVYPELARRLEASDVGQKVVRVLPSVSGSAVDWRCVSSDNIDCYALQITRVHEHYIRARFISWRTLPNDICWCTVDELHAFTPYYDGIAFKDVLPTIQSIHGVTQIILDYVAESSEPQYSERVLLKIENVIRSVIHEHVFLEPPLAAIPAL